MAGVSNDENVQSVIVETSNPEKQEQVKHELIENCMTTKQKNRLSQSLSVCQIIKNVIKTRMELCKKGKSSVQCANRIAKKLVKKQKRNKFVKRCKNEHANRNFVIDLNINLNVKK